MLPVSLELSSQFNDAAVALISASSASSTEEVEKAGVAILPSFDALGDINPAVGIAAAVAVLGTLVVSSNGGAKDTSPRNVEAEAPSEPEPEPIDVSIPYDAAAALTYCALKSIEEIDDAEEFAKFKAIYEAYTVAEVSFKKVTRDFEGFKATLSSPAAAE